MELAKISNQELLKRMDKLVQSERKLTHVILCHINEVESRRLYANLGFDSMFNYLTRHCGYGEDSAYRRLQAARLLKKNPVIATKLEDGSLNLTQLTQVQKCLKQESKMGNVVDTKKTLQVIEQIENKSSFETKKVLAVEFNLPVQTHEVVKPQRDESVRLELTLSAEQMKMLEQVKSLLSHSLSDGNWSEVITYLADKHLKKYLGKDHQFKKQDTTQSQISTMNPTSEKFDSEFSKVELVDENLNLHQLTMSPSFTAKRKRVGIKSTLRRRILKKANYSCEYVDQNTNVRCQSHYQLQIDHCIPFAHGGSDEEGNLRVFCRSHNLLSARQWGLSDY